LQKCIINKYIYILKNISNKKILEIKFNKKIKLNIMKLKRKLKSYYGIMIRIEIILFQNVLIKIKQRSNICKVDSVETTKLSLKPREILSKDVVRSLPYFLLKKFNFR